MATLHRAMDEVLTERQRHIFVAIVLVGVPLDVLVDELGSNRNAIYKMLFDARRKLRAASVGQRAEYQRRRSCRSEVVRTLKTPPEEFGGAA